MPEVIEPAAPEVIAEPSPRRFEIPEFTKQTAAAEPIVEAPKAESPPATETPPKVEPPVDPVAEAAAQARKQRLQINRLHKQLAEEKVRRELYEQEAVKLRKPAEPDRAGAPDPSAFTDIKEYEKAVRVHERAEASKEIEQKQLADRGNAFQQNIESNWNNSADAAAAKYDDFDVKVGDLKSVDARGNIIPWAVAIKQAENSADVAYYLGSNLKEAERIIALNPIAQIYEIGKISAKLISAPPVIKPASKAPAPITPVQGAAVVSEDLASADMEKFIKMRNRQLGRTR